MPIAQTLGPYSVSPGTSLTTPTATVTAGNTILALIFTEKASGSGQTISTVADQASNAFTKDGAQANTAASTDRVDIWRYSNIPGSSVYQVTITPSASSYTTVILLEVTGALNSGQPDGSGSGAFDTIAGSQPHPGAFSTTNANDLIILAFAINQNAAAGTVPTGGYARLAEHHSGGVDDDCDSAYLEVTSTQSGINPPWTGLAGAAHLWACLALAYKLAGGTTYTISGQGGGCDGSGAAAATTYSLTPSGGGVDGSGGTAGATYQPGPSGGGADGSGAAAAWVANVSGTGGGVDGSGATASGANTVTISGTGGGAGGSGGGAVTIYAPAASGGGADGSRASSTWTVTPGGGGAGGSGATPAATCQPTPSGGAADGSGASPTQTVTLSGSGGGVDGGAVTISAPFLVGNAYVFYSAFRGLEFVSAFRDVEFVDAPQEWTGDAGKPVFHGWIVTAVKWNAANFKW